MKSKHSDLYFRITAILFSVCCCAFKSLRAGTWYGKRFFIVQTAESPLDLTRRVWNESCGEDKAPHLHPIRISFYEYTGIFDQVEILYNERRSPELHGSGDFHCKMICIFCISML